MKSLFNAVLFFVADLLSSLIFVAAFAVDDPLSVHES